MSAKTIYEVTAIAALEYIQGAKVIGVGSGVMIDYFINILACFSHAIEAVVVNSACSAERVRRLGIDVLECRQSSSLPVYIEEAAIVNKSLHFIKKDNGSLCGAKVCTSMAERVVCMTPHYTPLCQRFSDVSIPVEVLPIARAFVGRKLCVAGLFPKYRHGAITEQGNNIIDIQCHNIQDPGTLEHSISNIPGAVACGLHALRGADIVLMAGDSGITRYTKL